MTRHCRNWSAIRAEVTPTGGTRQAIEGAAVNLVRIVVPAGTKAPSHSHDHEQFVQVISGSGTLETEQGRVPFETGSVFHFPPGIVHAAEFTTETVLIETNLDA